MGGVVGVIGVRGGPDQVNRTVHPATFLVAVSFPLLSNAFTADPNARSSAALSYIALPLASNPLGAGRFTISYWTTCPCLAGWVGCAKRKAPRHRPLPPLTSNHAVMADIIILDAIDVSSARTTLITSGSMSAPIAVRRPLPTMRAT